MTIFNQNDYNWSGKHLGTSIYTMGGYGCLTTDIAQALLEAGWDTDPGRVVDALNAIGGYTDSSYSGGAGLLYWYKVAKAFPQFSFLANNTGKFRFVQVLVNNRYEHWLLELSDGTYLDPEFGNTGMKSNYTPTGIVYSANINSSPIQVPIQGELMNAVLKPRFAPFETDLSPNQTYSDEVKRVQEFLIWQEFMVDQGNKDGYYGSITASAVNAFQKKHGISGTAFGWWYPMTRGVANSIISNPDNFIS